MPLPISNGKLEFIHLNKGDVVIHTCDFGVGIDEAYKVHSNISNMFPDNDVITIPDTSSIALVDKESAIEFLQEMIDMIKRR